jgi:hypothetical protein
MTIDYLGLAHETGRRLVADAQWHSDECSWIVNLNEAPTATPAPRRHARAGVDLYSGATGIGLFLAELWAHTTDADILRAVEGVAQHAQRQAATVSPSTVGLFNGRVGIAWFFTRLATLLRSDRYAQCARDVLHPIAGHEHEDRGLDVIAGSAGAIPAILRIGDALDWPAAFDIAHAMGEHVIRHAHHGIRGWWWTLNHDWERQGLTGLAHGAGGFGYSLLELYAATGDTRYRFAAERAFAYEEASFNPAEGNWPDYRNNDLMNALTAPGGREAVRQLARDGQPFPPASNTYMAAWCHGAPGIALTRLRAFQLLGTAAFAEQARAGVRSTQRFLAAPRQNASLCHGAFGNLETILLAQEVLAGDDIRVDIDGLVEHQATRRRNGHWSSGDLNGDAHPGLLLGDAGAGYFMLRMHSRDVPPILFLTAPRHVAAAGDPLPDELLRAELDVHFGSTRRAFERLGAILPDATDVASAGQPQEWVGIHRDQITGVIAGERDQERQALLADAATLELARFDALVEHDDFTKEVWRAMRRPLVHEVPLEERAFVRSPSVRLVERAHDWDAWLGGAAAGMPPRLDRTATDVLCLTTRGVSIVGANRFAAAVLDLLDTPLTVPQITACIIPDAEHSDPATVELWQGRVVALVQSLLGGGMIEAIIVDADKRPALSLVHDTISAVRA